MPISAYFIKNDVNTFVSFLMVDRRGYLRLYLRNIGTILYNARKHTSISSSVVTTEKLNLMVESSRDFSTPIAFNVAEGCGLCAEQALPADT